MTDREARGRSRDRGASAGVRHFHVQGDRMAGHTVGAIGQSSPLVRLNMAKEMIKKANGVMDRMEGVGAAGQEGGDQEDEGAAGGDAAPPAGRDEAAPAAAAAAPAGSVGVSSVPIQFSLGGLPAEATIHVQAEGQGGSQGGLAEAISAMMQQATSV